MVEKTMTLKTLQEKTQAPAYLIQYLKSCNRLPIVKASKGQGYPTLYAPEAVEIVKDHMAKRNIRG